MTPAQQTFHILKKDIRAHWSELLTLTLLNLLLIVVSTETWSAGVQRDPGPAATFSGSLPILISILLGVGWCLLIPRVIHGESPASHVQYWLTRPYSRMALLSATGLFILLFVHAMTVVTQILILQLSGVPWLFRDLWLNQLVLLILITLPAMTIGVLTRTQGQFLLIALPVTGIALVSLLSTGFIGDDSYVLNPALGPGTASSTPVRNLLWAIVSLPALAIITVFGVAFQYLKRQTRTTTTCCAAGVAVTAVVIAALPDALASWTHSKLIGMPADRKIVRLGSSFEGRTTTGTVHELENNEGFEIAVPLDWSYRETRGLVLVGPEARIRSASGLEYLVNGENDRRTGIGFTGVRSGESLRAYLGVRIPGDVFETIADDDISITFSFDLKEYGYYPANPIPRDGGSTEIDGYEQCAVGPYTYIICRRSFFGPEGPIAPAWNEGRNAIDEPPDRSLIITRQAAAIPFAIDPILDSGRYRERAGDEPVTVWIAAPRSYAPASLEIEGVRLRDWLVDSDGE
jgi:hypothetical protein